MSGVGTRARGEPFSGNRGAVCRERRALGGVERPIDQEDVLHRIAPLRIDDVRLAAKHAAIDVDRDEESVGAVGDVLDDAGRQADEPGVIVDGGVESATAPQVAACEHQVADTTVPEVERTAARELLEKCGQPIGNSRARRGELVHGEATEGGRAGQCGRKARHGLCARSLGQARIEELHDRWLAETLRGCEA